MDYRFKGRRNPFKNGFFWSKKVKPGENMPSVHILYKILDVLLILTYWDTINIEWSFFCVSRKKKKKKVTKRGESLESMVLRAGFA